MEFYEVIKNRNSANKFSDEPVNKESLDRIIDAAMRSYLLPQPINKKMQSILIANIILFFNMFSSHFSNRIMF